jgi:hypothetical protein
MFRARIVFNGSLDNEYPFYSIAYPDESGVRRLLEDMKPVLAHTVSVQLQQGEVGPGGHVLWTTVPAF